MGQTLHVQLTDVLLPSFHPDAIILTVHWRIEIEMLLISKEDLLCLINSQSSEQSFGTRESFLFYSVQEDLS